MSVSSRNLPFPHNLSPGQKRVIEAIEAHGTVVAASVALSITAKTASQYLVKARRRAGVTTTKALVERYRTAA
jgi:hypothetical protein